MNTPLGRNPLKTRADLEQALFQIVDPTRPFFSEGKALLTLGQTGSVYSFQVSQIEAFIRLLWGLIPFAQGGGDSDLWDDYRQGLMNGTDPQHPEYWGVAPPLDQRLVEMAALGVALSLAPRVFWDPLPTPAQTNLALWLNQINDSPTNDNNWKFFCVLVNMGLKSVGAPFSQEKMDEALDCIESFYVGDGWYTDGVDNQADYYIPFAIHFYSLIYSKVMTDDPVRCHRYRERATLFAQDFLHWFADDGSALPYGRSLVYRFAHSAFWSALAWAEVPALPLGVLKGLILRNLRWWFAQPIFGTDGLLSIGYRYPNLVITEGYNAPGGPYWALKSFLVLGLPPDHEFWTVPELPLPALSTSVQPVPRMHLIHPSPDHVLAFTTGQYARFEPVHLDAKYAKFVYSNVFGFSVSKAGYLLEKLAADSMLALGEGDGYYRVRRRGESHQVEKDYLVSVWRPWNDVEVKTWLFPGSPWHVRIHRIRSARALVSAEGGFAVPHDWEGGQPPRGGLVETGPGRIHLSVDTLSAGILDGPGGSSATPREARLIQPEANTNVLHPRTAIPTLLGNHAPGETWLVTLVHGSAFRQPWDQAEKMIPEVRRGVTDA